MLLELHLLQNHAPSNLNRDESHTPKDCSFGGFQRARISSQSLKRSLRVGPSFARSLQVGDQALGFRTRQLPTLVAECAQQRLEESGVEPALARELAQLCGQKASGFGSEAAKESSADPPRTPQSMFLCQADVDAVAQVMVSRARELVEKDPGQAPTLFKKIPARDFQEHESLSTWRPVTVDLALFGRLITSPAFQNLEPCVQVAHAFSTHQIEMEFDYFTAVDDLHGRHGRAADMIGTTEFQSACFYKYFSLHLPGLLENLDPDGSRREEAAKTAAAAVPAFFEAAIVSGPSGKQNAFAAHNLPSLVLLEARPYAHPVSYANAFAVPVVAAPSGLIEESVRKLREHVEKTDRAYAPPSTERLWFSLDGHEPPRGVKDVGNLAGLRKRLTALARRGAKDRG